MDKEGRHTAGALKAAEGAINAVGWGLSLEQTAEIISRETSDQEMADLLREYREQHDLCNTDDESDRCPCTTCADVERLLTKIGETP